MDGLIWSLFSVIIGGGIGGSISYFYKDLPASQGTNTISGALAGLLTSLLNGGHFNVGTFLAVVGVSAAIPAAVNYIMKYIEQEHV